MSKALFSMLLAYCLVACGVDIRLPTPFPVPASRTPRIVTETPALRFATLSPSATSSPTETITTTPTRSPSPTSAQPKLELAILGCDTSIDLAHQMGEVTNAYVRLSNIGESAASNVCTVLSSSDEGRPHPDKLSCVLSLPPRSRVTLKLTVDTGFGVDSLIRVDVSSAEKVSASLQGGSCKAIGAPKQALDPFGLVQPIP